MRKVIDDLATCSVTKKRSKFEKEEVRTDFAETPHTISTRCCCLRWFTWSRANKLAENVLRFNWSSYQPKRCDDDSCRTQNWTLTFWPEKLKENPQWLNIAKWFRRDEAKLKLNNRTKIIVDCLHFGAWKEKHIKRKAAATTRGEIVK